MLSNRLLSLAPVVLFAACNGSLVQAPHRARESELGPAAADARYEVVVDRAGSFERANAKSRDVYWYRVWRASGMISIGQVAEGEQLVDQVLTELTSPDVNVADSTRLRLFAYDTKAKGALLRQQPIEAIGFLDRALSLAIELKPDTGGKCDRELMVAARIRQIMEIAANAGDTDRPARSRPELERRLAEWSMCLARADYPLMHALGELRGNLGLDVGPPAAVVAAAPAAPAPAAPAPAPAPAGKPAPAAKPAPAPAPAPSPAPAPAPAATGLKTAAVRYGPVDSTPYKEQIESLVRLLDKNYRGIGGEAVIRVDGSKRALKLRFAVKKFEGVGSLVPLFKNAVVFFERTRDVEPKLDEVLVLVEAPEGATSVLAQKTDVFDLFVDRIDAQAFQSRLVEVR